MHIRKRNKRYQCIVKINRKTLSRTFSTYAEGRAWGKIQEHTYIKGSQIFNPKALTLQSLMERYLDEFEELNFRPHPYQGCASYTSLLHQYFQYKYTLIFLLTEGLCINLCI